MACIPTSFTTSALLAPIENSPPGFHAMPAGPLGCDFPWFSAVASNSGAATGPGGAFAKGVCECPANAHTIVTTNRIPAETRTTDERKACHVPPVGSEAGTFVDPRLVICAVRDAAAKQAVT